MNMRIRTLLLLLILASAAAYAAPSKLAAGHWVKVKVEREGIHQISHELLRQWGFDNPEAVGVYGYGGSALALERIGAGADDLPAAPSVHTADGRLLFYGDADGRLDLRSFEATESQTSENGTLWRRNLYDTGGYYFLSDCGAGSPGAAVAAPTADTEVEYTGHMHADVRDTDAVAPMGMGIAFGEREFSDTTPYIISFEMRDRTASELSDGSTARAAVLIYNILVTGAAGNTTGTTTVHSLGGDAATLTATHTGATGPRYSVNDYEQPQGRVVFPDAGEMPSGNISGELALTRPAGGAAFSYYFDRSAMVYCRRNRLTAGESQLVMHYPLSATGRNIRLESATASTRLWDVSDPAAVRELELRHDADGSAVAAMPRAYDRSMPGRMVLFDTAAEHLTPEYAGEVAAQNIHGAPTPVMAIITTAACEPAARRLAEAHGRADGISVGVFLSEQVCNEFASGALTPTAYRRMARMFYDRDPDTFRYVLLVGAANWDTRGVVAGANGSEQVPAQACTVPSARYNSNSCYATDSYVGCLDDFNFLNGYRAQMTVAVGRITARTDAEATSMIEHTIDYIENPPSTATFYNALMASAAGDQYEHYYYSEDMAAVLEGANRGFVVSRVPMMAYPMSGLNYVEANRQLRNHLGEGRGLLSYFGHAAAGNSLGSAFYTCAIAESINYEVAPLAMLATCNAFGLDSSTKSLAQSMLGKRGGGAIGVVAATRSVYSDYNRSMGVAVAEAYAAAKPGDTTGDIFMRAHNKVVAPGTSASLCYNTKCYNLCGDPAVRLPIAQSPVTLTSAGSATGTARGLAPLLLSGTVADADGNPDSGFNGTADIVVYDTPTKGTVVVADPKASSTPEVNITNVRMATATVAVNAGRWNAEIFLPEFSAPGATFALSVDATDGNGHNAHGFFKDLPTEAGPASTDGIDTSAPEIVEMYAGTPDFADGDVTGPDVDVRARISVPATGININAAPLRGASRITLDGSSTVSNLSGYMQPDGEGYMMLTMPYSALGEGRHSVTLSVANNVGAVAERTIGFTVGAAAAAASLSVEERPARTQATLTLEHALGSAADALLVVEDHAGRTVLAQPFEGKWDLKDNAGAAVADGVYHAYVLVRSGSSRCSTPRTEIIVVRE